MNSKPLVVRLPLLLLPLSLRLRSSSFEIRAMFSLPLQLSNFINSDALFEA